MFCNRCVLPEYRPDITLNNEGTCNICVDFDKTNSSEKSSQLLEVELVKILSKYKNKGKYDCLVMCSGGKDSTAALYYIRERYKMNPLVFTFDHGFENEEAIENIKRAVEILGVDWLFLKSDFMQDFFAEIVKTKVKVPICSVCSFWYMQTTYDLTAKFKIPLIIAGWTRGQMSKPSLDRRAIVGFEFLSMARHTADFVGEMKKKYPKYRNFPQSMKEVQRKNKTIVLSPHWFLPVDSGEYTELIKNKLKWKSPQLSYPLNSTNCYLNFLSVYLTLKDYGFSHYHIEMSKLIRVGELTREEALSLLTIDFKREDIVKIVDEILKKLGCNRDDL